MTIHHARFLAHVAPEKPLAEFAHPAEVVHVEPTIAPARRVQWLSCGACLQQTPQIGSTIRRVDGLRRRVGPCCARGDGGRA